MQYGAPSHSLTLDPLRFTLAVGVLTFNLLMLACESKIDVQVRDGGAQLSTSEGAVNPDTDHVGAGSTDENSQSAASDSSVDTMAPLVGTLSSTSNDVFSLSWGAASDDAATAASLEYYVCSGPSLAAIDTVEKCLAATKEMDWTANTLSLPLTNSPGTTHYYNIVVRDPAGNQAAYPGQTLTVPTFSVVSVSSTNADATYTPAGSITITVQFSQSIVVTGSPRLALAVNSTPVYATFVSATGDTMSLQYTVGTYDISSDLDYVASGSLDLNGGTIRNAGGSDANVSLPTPGAAGSLSANKNIIVGNPPAAFIIAWARADSSQVTLDWAPAARATSYTIKRGTSSGVYPATVSTNATAPFSDTGLTNGTLYYYMITAVNAAGSTNATAEASATPVLFTADAGPDRTAAGTITLIGNLPPGTVSKQWSQVSGPGTANFGTTTAKNTTVSATTAGTYVLRYTLTDSSGVTAQDDMTFVKNATVPTFTSIDLIGAAANAEIDRLEARSGEFVAGNLVGSYDTASYLLTDNAYSCSSYAKGAYRSMIPKARDFIDFADGNQYKVCTRVENANGLAMFGASAAITRETVSPVSDAHTVKAISSKSQHTCAILDDDNVRCWGAGANGALGYEDGIDRGLEAGSMAAVGNVNLGAGRTAKFINTGGQHTCAILDNDTLKCWGENGYGQLGYDDMTTRGSTSNSMTTLSAVNLGGAHTAKAVSLGFRHTCAILDDDTVKCWGYNGSGQLGYDSTLDKGGSAGSMAALGTVDLGAGRTAKALATGNYHTCAILDTNAVKCWGHNYYGQLGYDDQITRGDAAGEMAALSTVNLGAGRTAKAITAGSNHTCAILDNDTLKCWGHSNRGKIGTTSDVGKTAGSMAALSALNVGTGRTVKAVSGGEEHTCAILDNNALRCWGSNYNGQLGFDYKPENYGGSYPGAIADLPYVILGSGRTAVAVATGSQHTCAVLDDARLKCWGYSDYGANGAESLAYFGSSAKSMRGLPAVNLGAGRSAKKIVSADDHSCAILDDDTVKCWGNNASGQLGYEDTASRGDTAGSMAALGTVNLGSGRTAKDLAVSSSVSCAILDNDTLKCWGEGYYGQLGYDSSSSIGGTASSMSNLLPVNLGSGRTAKAVTVGASHVCAILDDDTVKCWGANNYGQLGYEDLVDRGTTAGSMASLSTVKLGSGRTAKAISAGMQHTCAILDDDSVKCWGYNASGCLGYDDTTSRGGTANSMVTLRSINLGNGRTAKQISAGGEHTCALLDNETVKCWGRGVLGQLGYDGVNNKGDSAGSMSALNAVNIGSGRKAKSITAGYQSTCAILDNDALKCWGSGAVTGYDDTIRRGGGDSAETMMTALDTVNVGSGRTVKSIVHSATGYNMQTACAILDDNTAKCWGSNNYGQLGYDTTANYGGGVSMTELQPIYLP